MSPPRAVVAAGGCLLLALGLGARDARPVTRDTVTITMLAGTQQQPGWRVLIANFERVYPSIAVSITYAPSAAIQYQIETAELAAGNGPDIVLTFPGCGTPISVCELAKDGYLAPLVKEPWTKRAIPLVTSMTKYGAALVGFEPNLSLYGIFTNDGLFKKLGLEIPQTFSQLLDVCQKAKSDGRAAVFASGTDGTDLPLLIEDLAVATVYGKDPHWAAELRAGKVTFDGSAGWHLALQELVEMNDAGCFEPGMTGTSLASAEAQFDQGQGLMLPLVTSFKGAIDAGDPHFTYSHHPFPSGSGPDQTSTFLNMSTALGVNVHSSPESQAAAHAFIDFVARPKQNALLVQILGGMTQYQLLKGQIPAFMSADASVIEQRRYVIVPTFSWWNESVLFALQQDGLGLITGQETIGDVLSAMDAAWKQGPS